MSTKRDRSEYPAHYERTLYHGATYQNRRNDFGSVFGGRRKGDLKITRNVKTNDGHVPPPLSPGCCGVAYRFYPMQVETIHSYPYIQLFQRLPMCLTPPSFSETMCRESVTSHRSPCLKTSPRKEGRKEIFYLTTHSTHFIYGYMASDI